jgi:hypothetical protein
MQLVLCRIWQQELRLLWTRLCIVAEATDVKRHMCKPQVADNTHSSSVISSKSAKSWHTTCIYG